MQRIHSQMIKYAYLFYLTSSHHYTSFHPTFLSLFLSIFLFFNCLQTRYAWHALWCDLSKTSRHQCAHWLCGAPLPAVWTLAVPTRCAQETRELCCTDIITPLLPSSRITLPLLFYTCLGPSRWDWRAHTGWTSRSHHGCKELQSGAALSASPLCLSL